MHEFKQTFAQHFSDNIIFLFIYDELFFYFPFTHTQINALAVTCSCLKDTSTCGPSRPGIEPSALPLVDNWELEKKGKKKILLLLFFSGRTYLCFLLKDQPRTLLSFEKCCVWTYPSLYCLKATNQFKNLLICSNLSACM